MLTAEQFKAFLYGESGQVANFPGRLRVHLLSRLSYKPANFLVSISYALIDELYDGHSLAFLSFCSR